MKTLIDNYKNMPGKHCGSAAMRNLIAHYCDLHLTEQEVIGLGSATDFIYIKSPQSVPKILTLGRSRSMEVDVAQSLGIDYRETPDLDNHHAWEVVKQEVVEGRPTMLSGDTFYLDYRGFGRHHFPGHRFVIVGFDDEKEKAFIADREDSTYELCSYSALFASRNPPMPISTYNLWGKFHGREARNSLSDAIKIAIKRTVERMLGIDTAAEESFRKMTGDYDVEINCGLKGLATFYDDFLSWKQRPDWQSIVSYASNCFEHYGTGGGNFRLMYASFLESAHQHLPESVDVKSIEMCREVAKQWRFLSEFLFSLSRDESKAHWNKCHQQIGLVYEQESGLYNHLNGQIHSA